MSSMLIIFYSLIAFLQSQRVTILSSPVTSTSGWHTDHGGGIVTSSMCPGAATCYRITGAGNDEVYRFVNTRGYSDIQISYDIRTEGVLSGEACSFWWVVGTQCPSCGGWTQQSSHTANDAPQSIVHNTLPSNLDNTASVGIDWWADIPPGGYCYLNNVAVTGIELPPTPDPTPRPTLLPTSKPTQNPTLSPTSDPTQIPTTTPTANPTQIPTATPTSNPTQMPTLSPTNNPTPTPTAIPTTNPTLNPTKRPTLRVVIPAPVVRSPTFGPTEMDHYVDTTGTVPPKHKSNANAEDEMLVNDQNMAYWLVAIGALACCVVFCGAKLLSYYKRLGIMETEMKMTNSQSDAPQLTQHVIETSGNQCTTPQLRSLSPWPPPPPSPPPSPPPIPAQVPTKKPKGNRGGRRGIPE
eukprot:1151932_1